MSKQVAIRVWTRDGQEIVTRGKRDKEGFVKTKEFGNIAIAGVKPRIGYIRPFLRKKQIPVFYHVEGNGQVIDTEATDTGPIVLTTTELDEIVENHYVSDVARGMRASVADKAPMWIMIILMAVSIALQIYFFNESGKVTNDILLRLASGGK